MTDTSLKTKKFWEHFLKQATLSHSGWRRIFNSQGNPQSLKKDLDKAHAHFTVAAGEVIALHFKGKASPIIALARDSRPTGKAISDILLSVLSSKGIKCWDMGVTALPQCAATVKANFKLVGFVYITASHNPPGYNGIKIGNRKGAVISSNTNQRLVGLLKKKLLMEYRIKPAPSKSFSFDPETDYRLSLLQNMGYRKSETRSPSPILWKKMITDISEGKYAIGCDFNGSARINALDRSLIQELGIRFLSFNNRLGQFAHDIVPEQRSLDPLREMMGNEWRGKNVLFGYAVDCDGDRGNIVLNTLRGNRLLPLVVDAQTTFALTVLAELCYLQRFFPLQLKKSIIVANGPTSLRVDELAEKFGIQVARAEVGEANVVALAAELRRRGKHTPVMGEGSNGGSIIHPAVVRDPLSMVTSLIKLLFLDNGKASLRNIAVEKLGCPPHLKEVPHQFFLGAIIPYLNTYHSTSVFEPTALISNPCSTTQKNFKRIYEELWEQEWEKKKESFHSWGISNWEILNYEGVDTFVGAGNRHGKEDGGHKINFKDRNAQEIGFIWFRFSKTEPVLRLCAEYRDPSIQKKLFSLQRRLLIATAKKDSLNKL